MTSLHTRTAGAEQSEKEERMGLFDNMKNQANSLKDAMDTVRKIELSAPMTIEDVFAALQADAAVNEIAAPELKKGLTGVQVRFPKIDRVTPVVTVKENIVTLRKDFDGSTKGVSVLGGPRMVLDKDLRGKNKWNTLSNGNDYFKAIAEAIENALQGK